jgi:hypothetical protein
VGRVCVEVPAVPSELAAPPSNPHPKSVFTFPKFQFTRLIRNDKKKCEMEYFYKNSVKTTVVAIYRKQ